MEAAVVGGLIKAVLPKLLSLVSHEYKLHKGANRDIEYLRWELLMIVGAIEDEESIQGEQQHQIREVSTLLMEKLRFLAYGIEDCMDRIKYLDTRKQHSSLLSRSIKFPKTMLDDRWIATETRKLKELTKEAYECVQTYTNLGSQSQQASSSCVSRKDEEWSDDPPSRLVGIKGPMSHLLQHLAEAKGRGAAKANKLKVIAIVGFFGMGKTTLAAEVYKRSSGTGSSFQEHAWVSAKDKQASEVLNQLLHKLKKGASSSKGTSLPQHLPDLRKSCAEHLMKKRYLIVIDDIRTEDMWTNIKSAFPVDNGISSRIVITTTSQRVANDCTSMKGYVLRMSRLDEECSKELFCLKASPSEESFSYTRNHPDSDTIVKKCRGQPLALVTAAKFMRTNGWPTDSQDKNLCGNLSYHLQTDESFEAMRQVLNRNYTSLRCHALKSCLLYFAMFPSDCQIRRKSLLRRWLAEGFLELHSEKKIPDPFTAFQDLMDRNIIEPTCVSNNQRVKACRTYGLMHEFLLHMSTSQKFATLLCGEMTEHKYVRRLSIHKNTGADGENLETEVLSLVRSLLVIGEASDNILDFTKYHLLRVLDLEMCDNLKNGDDGPSKEKKRKVREKKEEKNGDRGPSKEEKKKKGDPLENICHLLLLKYLSLGKNIKILPKDITNLRVLQTLDLRGSGVNILPQKVLRMPGLIHLFGKFKLPDKLQQKSHNFLQKKESKLQTLAGFIADGRQNYLNIMGCMEKLKKVNVWCEPLEGADTTNWTNLRDAIQQFIHDEKEVKTGDRSLSLHFSECFGDSINSLEGPCYLSSLKLYGKLHVLPQFVTLLRGLKELCVGLESAKLERGLLEALTKLESLQYLKLIAKNLDTFVIKDGAFPNLLRLCFELEHLTIPIIQKGSMPKLVILQLLFKGMDDLCDIEMEDLMTDLKEIILDHGVNTKIKGKWEKAAKQHPNKPKVSYQITTLSGTTGNEESSTIGHGVNLEVSRSESPENDLDVVAEQPINGTTNHGVALAPEKSRSRMSVQQSTGAGTTVPSVSSKKQQSTGFSDVFSKIWCCRELFTVPLPTILRLCFMGLMCVLVGVVAVGWLQEPSSNKFC